MKSKLFYSHMFHLFVPILFVESLERDSIAQKLNSFDIGTISAAEWIMSVFFFVFWWPMKDIFPFITTQSIKLAVIYILLLIFNNWVWNRMKNACSWAANDYSLAVLRIRMRMFLWSATNVIHEHRWLSK